MITGGPGSGKTTLVSHIEELGYPCKHEISRDVTLEAQKQGIAQLFLTNPILFSQMLLEGRLKQFNELPNEPIPFLFYDRGMPDVTAYMDYIGSHYPHQFADTCMENRYDAIFVLPPWKDIYEQDNERYESFDQAERIHDFLYDGYEKYGYEVYDVPVGPIPQRTQFILEKLKELF